MSRPFALIAVVALAGCDSGGPDADSVIGTYTLVAYDGSALPSGGFTAGHLRLRVDQTLHVYDAEWTRDGVRQLRSGFYSVEGSRITFTDISGSSLAESSGTVDGDRITVTFQGGPPAPLTFQRD